MKKREIFRLPKRLSNNNNIFVSLKKKIFFIFLQQKIIEKLNYLSVFSTGFSNCVGLKQMSLSSVEFPSIKNLFLSDQFGLSANCLDLCIKLFACYNGLAPSVDCSQLPLSIIVHQ